MNKVTKKLETYMMRREKIYRILSEIEGIRYVYALKLFQTILCIYPCLHFVIQRKPDIFQRISNRQSIQSPLGIRRSPYPGFSLITVNPEDVAVIVVNVDTVIHQVVFSVYQFHCYRSFHINLEVKNSWAYFGI